MGEEGRGGEGPRPGNQTGNSGNVSGASPKLIVELEQERDTRSPETWTPHLCPPSPGRQSQTSGTPGEVPAGGAAGRLQQQLLRRTESHNSHSSMSSLVSESLVDAGQAGLLGPMLDLTLTEEIMADRRGGKEAASQQDFASTCYHHLQQHTSSDNLAVSAAAEAAFHDTPARTRKSILTDPGVYDSDENDHLELDTDEDAGDGCEDKDESGKIIIEGRPRKTKNRVKFRSVVQGRSVASYGKTIGEDHVNFVLMYDMLTGIRHSVSVCQAKPSRSLTEEDFRYARTYNFLQSSNDTTPSKYEFRFKDYCPWVFRSLREAFRIDAADYLVSLTGKYVLSEIGSPGKSGSFFYFSQDFRYIIKTIRQSEHEFLRRILRPYYEHIKRNPNSLLTRFYGLHRVRMSNIKKIYFVVMGNVFPPHKDIHETYDLKGSTKGRFVTSEELANRHLATLKDLNWLQKKRKLRLGPEKATLLMNQLKADCLFLAKMRIMDYSLLVGIHYMSRGNRDNIRQRSMKMLEPTTPVMGGTAAFKQTSIRTAPSTDPIPQERRMCIFYSEDGGFRSSENDGRSGDELYFLGVIDILTPYTVKKRIEHVFRSIKDDAKSISAVNPIDYSRRFLRFMAENILQDTDSDYATKKLPLIPEDDYAAIEQADGAVLISQDGEFDAPEDSTK